MDDVIYYGVANPPGEENGTITELMDQSQLEMAAVELVGKPLHINHVTHSPDGVPIDPSGVVISAIAHPKLKGALLVSFRLKKSESGNAAKFFLDGDLPEESKMRELSLGYTIGKNRITGIPSYHRIRELSICSEGQRDGCKVLGSVSVDDLLNHQDAVTYKKMSNFYKNLTQAYSNYKS